jgi:hypothetical protein
LKNPNDDRFLREIVACDEKWTFLNNPSQKRQWLDPKKPVLPVPGRDRFDTKFLLCVWWNNEGIIYFELLENGYTVNAKLYCKQLERMHAALEDRYPA